MFPDHGNRYASLRSGRAPGADADQTGGFPPPHPPRFVPSRRPWLGIPAGRARCARMFSPASRRGAFALVPFAAGGCKGLLRRFAPLRPSSLPALRTRPLRRCRWGGRLGSLLSLWPAPCGPSAAPAAVGGGSRWSLSAFVGVRCGFVFSRFVSRCRRVAWLAGFAAVRALVALARRFGASCRRVSLALVGLLCRRARLFGLPPVRVSARLVLLPAVRVAPLSALTLRLSGPLVLSAPPALPGLPLPVLPRGGRSQSLAARSSAIFFHQQSLF